MIPVRSIIVGYSLPKKLILSVFLTIIIFDILSLPVFAEEVDYPDGAITCESNLQNFNDHEFNNLTVDMNRCDWTSDLFPDQPHVFLLLKDIKVRGTLTYVPGEDNRRHYLALSNYAVNNLDFECPNTRQCELWLGEHPNPNWLYKYGIMYYLNLYPYGKITLNGAADYWLQHATDGTPFDPLMIMPEDVATKGPSVVNYHITPATGSPVNGGEIHFFQAGTKRLNIISSEGIENQQPKISIGIWAYIGSVFSKSSLRISVDNPKGFKPIPEVSRMPIVNSIVLDASSQTINLDFGDIYTDYLIYFGNPDNTSGGLRTKQTGTAPAWLYYLASLGGNLYYDNDNMFVDSNSIEIFKSYEYVMSYDEFVSAVDANFSKPYQFEESVVVDKLIEYTQFPPAKREEPYPQYTYHFDYVNIGHWINSKNIQKNCKITGSCEIDLQKNTVLYPRN